MSGEGVHNVADLIPVLDELDDIDDQLDDIEAALVIIDDEIAVIDANVDSIQAIVEAEAILEETGGQLTTDGTAQTIYINNAPAGVYKPICLKIDFANQTATETVVVRELYRIRPGGALSVHDEHTFAAVITDPIVMIDLSPTRYGIQLIIEKTVGTNRAYDWTVFYEV